MVSYTALSMLYTAISSNCTQSLVYDVIHSTVHVVHVQQSPVTALRVLSMMSYTALSMLYMAISSNCTQSLVYEVQHQITPIAFVASGWSW